MSGVYDDHKYWGGGGERLQSDSGRSHRVRMPVTTV